MPVLNLVLAALVIMTLGSGFVASWLAVTEFAPHRYAAFAMTIAIVAHVGLHWRALVAQVQRSVTRGLRPGMLNHISTVD